MADLTLLQQMKKELLPYILKEELIDEKSTEKSIGSGSYGTITKIKYCGTPCAAKEIHPIFLPETLSEQVKFCKGSPESLMVEKFCAEIHMLSEIRHPNVVSFIGVHIKKSSPFPVLVMELMDTSLAHCLEKCENNNENFPLAMKLFILQDIARALVYLHSREPPILHRDLSANNVLLTSNMMAKLADLGVAKNVNIGTLKMTQCPGNVVYMPPEALQENPQYCTEIDVYSYGVLGFHIFSEKWPLFQGAGSDTQRCFVDLIGEGVCLKETLLKCIDHNPKKRFKASEILKNIERVIMEHEIEEVDFLKTYNVAQISTKSVKEMSTHIADLTTDLNHRMKHIQKLESSEQNNNLVMQRLRCENEENKSTIKFLQEDKSILCKEIENLRTAIGDQKDNIQELSGDTCAQDHIDRLQHLIEAERQACQPCQQCTVLEKENKDLSDLVTSVQAQEANLSLQIKTKDEQLVIKKREVESKEEEIKQLKEKVELMNTEVESTKSLNSSLNSRHMERSLSNESDTASLINSMKIEQSEKSIELLETIKDLKKQLSENDDKHKAKHDRYRKMLQDLLIPHKGILCSSPPCAVLSCKLIGDVSLSPVEKISGVIKSITKAPNSSFEEVMPAVFYDFRIFFLCKLYCKRQKEASTGATIWYDPVVGKFDVITDEEIACFGHFGTDLLALGKNKQFFHLKHNAWKGAVIPSLPASNLHSPAILTYHSLLIIIDDNVVWVHDDVVCEWMQFELSSEDGDFKGSPKNSFAILAGKLFVCCSSEESVYSVELQHVIDKCYPNSKSNASPQEDLKLKQENGTSENGLKDDTSGETPGPESTVEKQVKHILHLSRILKGATFIFLHAENLLAFHNTPSSIDRVWYYDVQCYHWHNVEYNSSDANSVMLKNWISLSNCAGVLEFVWSWALSTTWGEAKLYQIQLIK